jgi:hypothetical protein
VPESNFPRRLLYDAHAVQYKRSGYRNAEAIATQNLRNL